MFIAVSAFPARPNQTTNRHFDPYKRRYQLRPLAVLILTGLSGILVLHTSSTTTRLLHASGRAMFDAVVNAYAGIAEPYNRIGLVAALAGLAALGCAVSGIFVTLAVCSALAVWFFVRFESLCELVKRESDEQQQRMWQVMPAEQREAATAAAAAATTAVLANQSGEHML